MTTKKIRTVFFGTPDFALPSLQACYEKSDLLAVVCQPDRPRGRGHKILPCETRVFAQQKNLPSFSPASLKKESPERSELLTFLEKNRADLFVVVAYGNLFPQSFLDMTRFGAVNVHASLLPRWRGAAPIQRSLEAGDPETGVCLQKMLLELDAGDVLAEAKYPIAGENALELSAKLSALGGKTMAGFLEKIAVADALPPGIAQDPRLVTFAEKIKKEEGYYRSSWTASEMANKVRAFRAWPQVKVTIEGLGEVKLLSARVSSRAASGPIGSVILDSSKAYLCCAGNTSLEIEALQPPGKGPLIAYSLLRNLASASGQQTLRVLEISSSETLKT